MSYLIKEIFYSIQGEGFYSGRPAVFCRFAGCNLWSGKEEGRKTAICKFCDTDFFDYDGPDGGNYPDASQLTKKLKSFWPQNNEKSLKPFVVLTGGEPLLQVDNLLVNALHKENFEIAVETNGTIIAPARIDWICVSPKAGAELFQQSGHELKLVYPQVGAEPEKYAGLDFHHFYLQPLDDADLAVNTKKTLQYILQHPQWRISLQLHKILGIK